MCSEELPIAQMSSAFGDLSRLEACPSCRPCDTLHRCTLCLAPDPSASFPSTPPHQAMAKEKGQEYQKRGITFHLGGHIGHTAPTGRGGTGGKEKQGPSIYQAGGGLQGGRSRGATAVSRVPMRDSSGIQMPRVLSAHHTADAVGREATHTDAILHICSRRS